MTPGVRCGSSLVLPSFFKISSLRPCVSARNRILKVSQSRVFDLMTGKWEKFSLEMLITLATRAGIHVSLKTAA